MCVIIFIRIVASSPKPVSPSFYSKCWDLWHWWHFPQVPSPICYHIRYLCRSIIKQEDQCNSRHRPTSYLRPASSSNTLQVKVEPLVLSTASRSNIQPTWIDILLGVDVFVNALLHGRRFGPPGSPIAFEMDFGWVGVLCSL